MHIGAAVFALYVSYKGPNVDLEEGCRLSAAVAACVKRITFASGFESFQSLPWKPNGSAAIDGARLP